MVENKPCIRHASVLQKKEEEFPQIPLHRFTKSRLEKGHLLFVIHRNLVTDHPLEVGDFNKSRLEGGDLRTDLRSAAPFLDEFKESC